MPPDWPGMENPWSMPNDDAGQAFERHQSSLEERMKIALVTALVAIAAPALAADDHAGHGHHAAKHGQAAADTQLVEGLVRKVDKSAGKVTLSHGPLPNGMPAMTMVFRVKEAAWVDRMKEGDRIRFKADQMNGAMTLVRYEPLK